MSVNIANAVAFHKLYLLIKLAFLPVSQLQIYTASLNDAIIVFHPHSSMLCNRRLLQTRNIFITKRSFVLILYSVVLMQLVFGISII